MGILMEQKPEILTFADAVTTAAAIAGALIEELAGRKAHTHISVTGGGLGSAIWPALVANPRADEVLWNRIHIWFSDERFVPAGDADRNDNAVLGVAGELGLLPEHIHSVPGPDLVGSVDESTLDYACALAGRRVPHPGNLPAPVFAVSILGIGPDGHVASLFPGRPELGETKPAVVAVENSPKPPPVRVSFTRPMLMQCQQLWMIAAGAEKAQAVSRALTPGESPNRTPAAGLRGREATRWFIDKAAAASL